MGKKFEHSHLVNQGKSGAGRRALASRFPKIIETPKSSLLLCGHATSNIGKALLNDLHLLKKPLCRKLQRKNDLLPFEAGGETHLENLCRLNDCSLFALTNHSKKRPDNLIVGRTFGFRILDMFEFGVEHFKPMALFKRPARITPGSSPLVIFRGVDWPDILQSTLLDWFRLPHDVKALNVSGIEHVIVLNLKSLSSEPFSTTTGKSKNPTRIEFTHYSIATRKKTRKASKDDSTNEDDANKNDANAEQSETETKLGGNVQLTEVGPSFDLVLRRAQTAPDAMRADAMRRSRDPAAPKKKKNVSRDEIGDKMGRVHVGRQDLSNLALARMKGLGKKRKASDLNDASGSAPDFDADVDNEADEQSGSDVAASPMSDKPSASGTVRKRVRFQKEVAAE